MRNGNEADAPSDVDALLSMLADTKESANSLLDKIDDVLGEED